MTDKEFNKFIKRWEEILNQQAALDLKVNEFARDLRKMFPGKGNVDEGDAQFKAWCCLNLRGVNDFRARELLTRAMAAAVFTDVQVLAKATGSNGTSLSKSFFDICALPRPRQVAIMQRAKDQGKRLLSVKVEMDREDGVRETKKVTPALDAKLLADFINKNVRDIPPPVREVIARYVKLAQERAAA